MPGSSGLQRSRGVLGDPESSPYPHYQLGAATQVQASPPPESPQKGCTLLVMTRRRLIIFALAPVAAVAGIGAHDALSKTSESTTMTCRVTEANGRVPAGAPSTLFGNGRLAVATYPAVEASPRTLRPDGSIGEKFPWFGASDLVGQLRISGKRLDHQARAHYPRPSTRVQSRTRPSCGFGRRESLSRRRVVGKSLVALAPRGWYSSCEWQGRLRTRRIQHPISRSMPLGFNSRQNVSCRA
jgi:hypothetical protein